MTSPPTGPAAWPPPTDGTDGTPQPGGPFQPGPFQPGSIQPGPFQPGAAMPPTVAAPAPARGSVLVDAVVALLTGIVVAALGIPLGWLWAAVAPRIPVVRVDGGFTYADAEPEQAVGADGWFLLLGAAAGIVLAILVWLLLRRWRGPLMAVFLVLGSFGSAWLAWWAGRHVGLAEFEQLRASATVGTRLLAPLGLRSTDFAAANPWRPALTGVLAVQALAAAFTYTCCAGWSRFSSLRGPDPEPTYPAYQAYPTYPAYQPYPAPTPPEGENPQFGPGRAGNSENASGTAFT